MSTTDRFSTYRAFILSGFLSGVPLLPFCFIFQLAMDDHSWVPVALIGTAEAFLVGFKNNQAYDRLWEARKIWGGIVNSSRSFASMVYAFDTNNEEVGTFDLEDRRKKLYIVILPGSMPFVSSS
ncbi:hypothetical protein [Chryseobacterium wanjuense]